MKKTKYLILGAGITGISFANFVKNDDYLILEKENEPGGLCRTIKQDGFTWDYSGHFFHFKNLEIKDYIFEKIDQSNMCTVNKISKIYYNDEYIDFPFQKNIHQLKKEEFIECLYDLFFRPEGNSAITFKDMLLSKFGKSISEKFLIPYNEKLYSCDLNDLDADAMGRFFPYADLNDIIRNMKEGDNSSYNSSFVYPLEGAMTYINSLISRIDSTKILLDHKVEEIDVEKKLVTTSQGVFGYDVLVSTMPFPNLLRLSSTEYDDDTYTYSKVLVFNLGFDLSSPVDSHWLYYPDKSYLFYRVGFYDNIMNQDRMSLYVEIGFDKHDTIDQEACFKQVLGDLKKAGIITNHTLLSWTSLVINPAYVHVCSKTTSDFDKKMTYLNNKDIYSIGRYGAWKYCSIEDNIIDAKVLAESFDKNG